jgi:hypothetical protein
MQSRFQWLQDDLRRAWQWCFWRCDTISMYTGHFLEFTHGGYCHSIARLHRRNGVSEGLAVQRLLEGCPGKVYGYSELVWSAVAQNLCVKTLT